MPSILLNTDPTRTTLLRNQFVADMVRRFKEVSKAIDALILGDEALGLINPGVRSVDELIGNVEFQAWRFQTNPQKVKSFRRWLQSEIDDNILTTSGGVVDKPWTATYIEPAYKKGVTRARTDTGRAFPGMQGTKEAFLRTSFTGTIATSKVELLYERAFTELEGVTAAMDQQLSRLLAEGLSQGQSPRRIATALKNQVTKLTNVRAKAIARTEIIRAHAEGQLDSFEVLGVKELDLLAEWSTAGDERVCFECAELEGVVMTIEEARGLLPRHPNCRCAWIPANVNARLPGQLFGGDKTSAIQKSIRAEGGVTKENKFRRSFKDTRPGSSWLGKEKVPRSAVPGAKSATPRGTVTPKIPTAPVAEKSSETTVFKDFSNSINKKFSAEFAVLEQEFPVIAKKINSIKVLSEKVYVKKFSRLSLANAGKVTDKIWEMSFDGSVFGKGSKFNISSALKEYKKQSILASSKVEHTLSHEFGHFVHRELSTAKKARIFDIWWKDIDRNTSLISKQIGSYAASNPGELFAESFVQFRAGKMSIMAKRVMKISGII